MLVTAQLIRIGDDRDMVLKKAAEAQAESGNTQGALETVAMIDDPWYRDSALYLVARLQAKSNDTHGAFEITTAIKHRMMWKCFALLHIAEAQESRSDREAALRTVAKESRDARRELGDTKGRCANYSMALLLVAQIKDSELRDRALTEIDGSPENDGRLKLECTRVNPWKMPSLNRLTDACGTSV